MVPQHWIQINATNDKGWRNAPTQNIAQSMQHCGAHLCPQESSARTPFCLVNFHFWLQNRYGDIQSKYPHFSRLSSHCGISQLGSLGVEANVASWLPPHWFCLTDSGATSFRPQSNLVRQCSKPVSPRRASLAVRFHEIEKDAAPKDIKPSPPIVLYLYHQNKDHPFYVVNGEYGGSMIIAQFKMWHLLNTLQQ